MTHSENCDKALTETKKGLVKYTCGGVWQALRTIANQPGR